MNVLKTELLGQRIKYMRKIRNVTQKTMARLLYVAQPAYARYEKGERFLPINFLGQIALYLDVDPNYLIGVIDYPAPYPKSPENTENSTQSILQEPYVALAFRHFPTKLYQEIKLASQERHVPIPAFIIQCCEITLKNMEGNRSERSAGTNRRAKD